MTTTRQEVLFAVTRALDELVPIDVREESACRARRVEMLTEAAIREAMDAKLTRPQVIAIAARLWASLNP